MRMEIDREEVGQVVLVLQGGGALGAYQAGVYQALHEAGIEPDWVIGTSIGAINAGLIAGNLPGQRLARLQEFWLRVTQSSLIAAANANPFIAAFAPRRHHSGRHLRLLRAKSRRLDRCEGKAWRRAGRLLLDRTIATHALRSHQ